MVLRGGEEVTEIDGVALVVSVIVALSVKDDDAVIVTEFDGVGDGVEEAVAEIVGSGVTEPVGDNVGDGEEVDDGGGTKQVSGTKWLVSSVTDTWPLFPGSPAAESHRGDVRRGVLERPPNAAVQVKFVDMKDVPPEPLPPAGQALVPAKPPQAPPPPPPCDQPPPKVLGT